MNPEQPSPETSASPPVTATAPPRKSLTAQAKLEVLHLVSLGLTINEAALRVGFSPRSIHRAAKRDEEFKQRLRHNRTDTHVLCMKTLKEAASEPKNWRCIPLLRKLSHLDREEQPEERLMGQFRVVLHQIVDVICRIVTDPAQRRQLDQEFEKISLDFRSGKQPLNQFPPHTIDNHFIS